MAVIKFIMGNLKKRKSYTVVICVLVFLAGLILTVTVSTIQGASKAYDQAFNNIEGPHMLYWFDEKGYKSEFKEWFEKQPGIQSVKLRKTIFYNGAVLKQDDKILKDGMDYFFMEYLSSDKMRLVDNVSTSGNSLKEDEIYLPYAYKLGCGLSAGDTVDYLSGSHKISFKIAGFVEEPIFGGDMNQVKLIFISDKDMSAIKKLDPGSVSNGLQMRIRSSSYDEAEVFKLTKGFNKEFGSNIGRMFTYSQMRYSHLAMPQIALVVMIAFALMLCVITVTIMRYAILATIEADYVNIGILKALGFTPIMIQTAITGQYAVLALFSGFISLMAGAFTTPLLGGLILKSSGLYFMGNLSAIAGILTLLVLVLLISMFSYLTARRTRKISPVRAISNGAAPVYFSSRLNVKLEKIGFLPFNIRMALKQVLTKSKRYVLLVSISALLVYAIVFLLGFMQVFNSERAINMLGGEVSDIDITAASKADVEKLAENIKKDYDVEWVTYQATTQLDIEDEKTYVRIKDEFDSTGQLSNLEGRHPRHDNEVAVTTLLKDRYKKGIGDYVTIKDKTGAEHEFIITGVFQSIDHDGLFVRMPESAMKVLDPDFEIKVAYIRLKSHDNIDGVIDDMKSRYTGYQGISNERKQMVEKIGTIQSVFSAISTLVFILTLIMIGFITLLIMKITVYSEIRELGIFKALGFSSGRLRLQLALRFALVTISGGLAGVVIETLFGAKLFSMVLKGAGVSSLTMEFSLVNAVIPVVMIALIAMASAYLSSGNTRKVSAYALINE